MSDAGNTTTPAVLERHDATELALYLTYLSEEMTSRLVEGETTNWPITVPKNLKDSFRKLADNEIVTMQRHDADGNPIPIVPPTPPIGGQP